jgi:propionyl-CoA synthetase
VPVIDHWWQTETGWTIAGNPVGLGALPVKLGSPAVPMPGYDIQVLDEAGKECRAASLGDLRQAAVAAVMSADAVERRRALQVELPVGLPGYYETADAGYMDEDGYLYIMARTDDIINVAGHRLSTGGMEEVLASHPDVAECAVVGIADKLKGQIPIGFVVLKSGVNKTPEEVETECVKLVRDKIGAVAALRTCDGRGTVAEDALGQDPARDGALHCGRCGVENARNDR